MRHRWQWVLFDLDGTLTGSGQGITRCAAAAMQRCGYAAPAPEDLGWMVGPPLRQSFARLAGTSDAAVLDALVTADRERFTAIGMYENAVCPGIPEVLQVCRQAGQTPTCHNRLRHGRAIR